MIRNDIQYIRHIINESVHQAINEGILYRELERIVRSGVQDLLTNGVMCVRVEDNFLVVRANNENSVLVDVNGKSVVVKCQDVENETLLTRSIIHGYNMLTLNLG